MPDPKWCLVIVSRTLYLGDVSIGEVSHYTSVVSKNSEVVRFARFISVSTGLFVRLVESSLRGVNQTITTERLLACATWLSI